MRKIKNISIKSQFYIYYDVYWEYVKKKNGWILKITLMAFLRIVLVEVQLKLFPLSMAKKEREG